MPRKFKRSITASGPSEGEHRDHLLSKPLGKPMPLKIDHGDYVRSRYGIDSPKAVSYVSGDTNTDRLSGECRDEQAWTGALEYNDHALTTSALQLAVLYLRPGVSRREADKALDQMFKVFPRKVRSSRPSVRSIERQLLRAAFEWAEQIAIETFGWSEQVARETLPPKLLVISASKINTSFAKYFEMKPLSFKTIERECRQWRRDTGRPSTFNVTERTDSRQNR